MDVLVFSAVANFSLFTQSFSSVLGIAKEERGVKKMCFMMVHFDGQKKVRAKLNKSKEFITGKK